MVVYGFQGVKLIVNYVYVHCTVKNIWQEKINDGILTFLKTVEVDKDLFSPMFFVNVDLSAFQVLLD